MSNTYEIACRECKESYWFGQRTTMYKPAKFMGWLVKHSTCGGDFALINEYAGNEPEWLVEDFKYISYDDVDDLGNILDG